VSVHAFPRPRFLRASDDEIRRRVQAWRSNRYRRVIRWISRHELLTGAVLSVLVMLSAILLGFM